MQNTHIYSMTAQVYQAAGRCLPVSYALVDTPKGKAFFCESSGKVIFLSFTDDINQGLKEFLSRWGLTKPSLRPEHCQKIADDIFNPKNDLDCARLLIMGSEFEIKVWEAIAHIQPGTVITYKEVAEKVGLPEAVLAVANAIVDNPIACLIPCHRVVRADGSLGGYRWGQESKRTFLEDEGFDLGQLSPA